MTSSNMTCIDDFFARQPGQCWVIDWVCIVCSRLDRLVAVLQDETEVQAPRSVFDKGVVVLRALTTIGRSGLEALSRQALVGRLTSPALSIQLNSPSAARLHHPSGASRAISALSSVVRWGRRLENNAARTASAAGAEHTAR